MNYLVAKPRWLLLIAALPAAGCLLVQPLDSATPDDDTAAAGDGGAGDAPASGGGAGDAPAGGAHPGGAPAGGAPAGGAPAGGGHTGGAGASGGHTGGAPAGGAPAGGGGAGGGTAGGGGGPDKALFIGTWTVTSGTGTLNCNGNVSSGQLTGSDTWSAGTTSDLVWDASTACAMKASINGRTATGERGFSCTAALIDSSTGVPFTRVVQVNSSAFVVLSDGKTATAVLSGTQADTAGGTTVTCDLSRQADYTKN